MKIRLWDTEKKVMLLPEYSDSEIMIQLDGSIMEYRESRNPYEPGQYFNVPEDRFVKMLSTGIKDKNGVEIYEGDVLIHNGCTGVLHSIKYYGHGKSFLNEKVYVLKTDCGFILRHLSNLGSKSEYECSIVIKGWTHINNYDFWNHHIGFTSIGNIYERPELLSNEE